ncbi:MAG: flagellar protein FlgN [Leptospira sp.]|nr:flagellar protein FlgN [Leptospira sp.]
MKQNQNEWVGNLIQIFKEEITIYRNLLTLEIKKKDAIHQTDGKLLESLTKETYHLMVSVTEFERIRMKAIEDVYEKEKLQMSGSLPILSEFLNQIDRDSNFRLKGLANELKDTVRELKEKIMLNERLLKTRTEIFSLSINALRRASETNVPSAYTPAKAKVVKHRVPVMLNTKV